MSTKDKLEIWSTRAGKALTAIMSAFFVTSAVYVGWLGVAYYQEYRYVEGLMQAFVGIACGVAAAVLTLRILNTTKAEEVTALPTVMFALVVAIYGIAVLTLFDLYPILYVWFGTYRIGPQ